MFLVPVVTGISEEIDLTWKVENGKVIVHKNPLNMYFLVYQIRKMHFVAKKKKKLGILGRGVIYN